MDNINKYKYVLYNMFLNTACYYFPIEYFFSNKTNKVDLDILKEEISYDDKGLYIHVPYCVTNCLYCWCNRVISSDSKSIKKYVKYLLKELEIIYNLNWKKKLTFTTIMIWWGTPSILSAKDMDYLFIWIYKLIDKSCIKQISIEASPFTLTNDKIDILHKHWVKRISIWIQSFDKNILKINNRIHAPYSKIKDLIKHLRKKDFYVELDLMVWIKWQDLSSCIKDYVLALRLWVDDIAFNYYMHHNNSTYKSWFDSLELKNKFRKKIEKLYIHNSKRDTFCFLENYSLLKERYSVIWLWVWAISNLWNNFSYTKNNLNNYFESLDKNELPIDNWIILNDSFKYIRYIIMNLWTGILEIDKFKETFNKDMLSLYKNEFDYLFNNKILLIDNWKIVPYKKGYSFISHLLIFMDEYISKLDIDNKELEVSDEHLESLAEDWFEISDKVIC